MVVFAVTIARCLALVVMLLGTCGLVVYVWCFTIRLDWLLCLRWMLLIVLDMLYS